MVNGRRVKLRYAHQGGSNPPILVVHGTQTDKLTDAYKRYLANTYRRVLSIHGTPIQMNFKSAENPFSEKKDGPSLHRISEKKMARTQNIRAIKKEKARKLRAKKR